MKRISPRLYQLIVAIALGTAAFAEEFSSEKLQQRALHPRAVEAVIWGMPAVNYERMLQAAIDNGAKLTKSSTGRDRSMTRIRHSRRTRTRFI